MVFEVELELTIDEKDGSIVVQKMFYSSPKDVGACN
jgi:hypothetical protein